MTKLEWVSQGMLSRLCGVSRRTISSWVKKSRIPAPRRAGRRLMFHLPSTVEAIEFNELAADHDTLAHFVSDSDAAVVHPLDKQLCRGIVDQLAASKSK